jgi:hypothetical protein
MVFGSQCASAFIKGVQSLSFMAAYNGFHS